MMQRHAQHSQSPPPLGVLKEIHQEKKELDSWLKKSTAVQKAIKKMANGSLNPEDVDLRKYGIFTPEQEREEEDRKARVRDELNKRQEEQRREDWEKERVKWWEGASFMYGSKEGEGKPNGTLQKPHTDKTLERRHQIIRRYSTDYSRWSDRSYIPDDQATNEDIAAVQKETDDKQNSDFESSNPEFCGQVKKDFDDRETFREKKDARAVRKRLEGNRSYKQKKYAKALEWYRDAMNDSPFAVNILMNIALCYTKLEDFSAAVEFADRACHVDDACVKAYFCRGNVHYLLKEPRVALRDFDKCLEIDPLNEEVRSRRDFVAGEIEDGEREECVKEMIGSDNCFDGEDKLAAAEKLQARLRNAADTCNDQDCIQLVMETMTASETFPSDDKETTRKHCLVVDYLVNKITHENVIAEQDGTHTSEPNNSNPKRQASDMLVSLLKMSPCARVYMRAFGNLQKIMELLHSNNAKEENSRTKTKEQERSLYYDILAASLKEESRSKYMLSEQGCIASAMSALQSTKTDMDTIRTKISACRLVATSLDDTGSESKAASEVLRNSDIISLIMSLFSQTMTVEREENDVFRWDGVAVCAEVLAKLMCRENELERALWKKYCKDDDTLFENNPVIAIIRALVTPCQGFSVSEIKAKKVRCDLTKTLLKLAAVQEMRPFFLRCIVREETKEKGKNFTAVHALLALAKSHKSELEECRDGALVTLLNATVARKGEDRSPLSISGQIKTSICGAGGIPILMNLCAPKFDHESSPILKFRASALLGRCVSTPQGAAMLATVPRAQQKLVEFFTEITTDESWRRADIPPHDVSVRSGTAVNLILIIAASGTAPRGIEGYSRTLMNTLPVPRRGVSKTVTRSSICLIPEPPKKGSACGAASSHPNFYVNVTKALIARMDSGRCFDGPEFRMELMERLVCVLANSSRFHGALAKNAAAALARLVRKHPEVMERCRELRGMEIMVELGRSGKV